MFSGSLSLRLTLSINLKDFVVIIMLESKRKSVIASYQNEVQKLSGSIQHLKFSLQTLKYKQKTLRNNIDELRTPTERLQELFR